MQVCAFTVLRYFLFFFFNDTATTEIYTLSLHDALPICGSFHCRPRARRFVLGASARSSDRKSTRLNSSHLGISYAVFCLKKKDTSYKGRDVAVGGAGGGGAGAVVRRS